LLRMPAAEIEAEPNAPEDSDASIATLVQRAIDADGAIDAVRDVFINAATHRATQQLSNQATLIPTIAQPATTPPIYPLARDYAQTLIAHATPLPSDLKRAFLAAVHHNLAHGESFAEWSFA
jgi:hypothetical protein